MVFDYDAAVSKLAAPYVSNATVIVLFAKLATVEGLLDAVQRRRERDYTFATKEFLWVGSTSWTTSLDLGPVLVRTVRIHRIFNQEASATSLRYFNPLSQVTFTAVLIPIQVYDFIDDGTLGGLLSDVLHDVEMIKKEAGIVGLELNPQKSEVVGCQEQPLTGVAAHYQKSWDSLRLFSMADTLLKNTTDELNRARLLAASYTYAPSYSTIAAQQAGAVGQQAEDKKAQKYKHLSSHHFFTPVAIETSGVYGPRTADFLKELGHRFRQVSGEASSFHYLAQRLSVAIQRGNSASVMGTMDGDGEEFFV
eukprot:Em0003g574a